jgi:hypothetical protein
MAPQNEGDLVVERGAGEQPSGALRGLVLTTTVVVTAVAVAAVGYGVAGWDHVVNEFALVAVFALLFIGGPAVFMWLNAVRVLGGNPSAAWRVQKHVNLVMGGMLLVGVETLVLTAQFTAFWFLACAFVVLMACGRLQKRVLLRDRVAAPPPNWHDQLVAEEAARRR